MFILILIIILLVSFITYDKIIKNDNNRSESVSENKDNSFKNNDEVISNEEAITIGNELYKKINDIYFLEFPIDSELFIIGDDGYTYSKFDYESEVKKYISSNFETKIKEEISIIGKDGVYYVADVGRGSNQYYCDSSLAIESIDANKIVFKTTISYDNVGTGPYKSECSNHIDYTKTEQFIIVKENGNWVIDQFVLPN